MDASGQPRRFVLHAACEELLGLQDGEQYLVMTSDSDLWLTQDRFILEPLGWGELEAGREYELHREPVPLSLLQAPASKLEQGRGHPHTWPQAPKT